MHSLCTAVCPYAFYTVALDHMEAGKASILCFCGASSDTELFKNHRSTIRFQGHRIATCLYRTPMGSCV